MKPLTIRIRANTKESLESEADEYDVSVSEYVRELIDKGREYDEIADRLDEKEERIRDLEQELADRPDEDGDVDELREEVARLEARNRDLTNQLAESNRRIDAANEIVEYAKDERTAQQRYREAGLLGKMKYTVFGMPSDDGEE